MSTERPSLERAFRDQCGGSVLGEDAAPEQLDLLRDPETGRLPANVYQLMRKDGGRGPGRPPGAGNRRNEVLAKLICQQHGDPVLWMASLYSRPLDQMIELVLIADSTAEREERLLGLVDKAEAMIGAAMRDRAILLDPDKLKGIESLLDRVFDAAKALKMKPGDLAIKAINLQLMAAKATAEYVHSKKPVEAVVSHKVDGVLVMPGVPQGATFDQADQQVRLAADRIAEMLAQGHIEPAQLADYRFEDGRLVDGDYEPVEDDDAEGQA